jgi:hypothetical protein
MTAADPPEPHDIVSTAAFLAAFHDARGQVFDDLSATIYRLTGRRPLVVLNTFGGARYPNDVGLELSMEARLVTAAGLVRWSLEAWVFPENATVTAEIECLLADENLSLFFWRREPANQPA